MTEAGWPEAANRRLRALLWQGRPIGELALRLGRPAGEVTQQMRRLGLAVPTPP